MQITAFDYIKDRSNTGGSLARLASLISHARAEAENAGAACLLFDNGDTFQGTPLADFIAANSANEPHPMSAALNALRYDAIGLGNHDFEHGLDQLGRNLAQLDVPVVCSNLSTAHLPMVRSGLHLEKVLVTDGGHTESIRIGILSTSPDKTALWSRSRLEDHAGFRDPVEAVATQSVRMRAEGVDIVIVLAHMGLALFDEGPDAQNRIQDVAALEDVDAVIGGHTHLRFPGPDHKGLADTDWHRGKVHGTPVVQPGPNGTDLGIIDLKLEKTVATGRWNVSSSSVALRQTTADTPEAQEIMSLVAPLQTRTRADLDKNVARIEQPMHSYFALAAPSPLPALLADAKRRVIQEALAQTEFADYPLLAAASTTLTGGIDGPDNFLFLGGGHIKRRHVAGMNPYANSVWAVKATGAQVVEWLERAALIFAWLEADNSEQPLIDTRIPGFRYDAIYGLQYEIDPSRPPRFDTRGQVQPSQTGRIGRVTWQGSPIDPEQTFIVATTDHRAGGGGLYLPIKETDIVVRWQTQLQDAVLSYLKNPDCYVVRGEKPWQFAPNMERKAKFYTAPGAEAYLDEIAHLHPEVCGETPKGFLSIRLSL